MNRTELWKKFRQSGAAPLGLLFLIAEALAVFLLPLLFHMDPVYSDVAAGFNAAPSAAHWLGTDAAARDLLARTLYGGRTSLFVGVSAALISVSIGFPLGLIAGYYRGIAETLVVRFCDLFMSFPSILLALILVSIVGPSRVDIILIIGVMGWAGLARMVYASVLSIREQEYIDSAISVGRGDFDILIHEVLPESLSSAFVSLSFCVNNAILQESGLSFLGLGIRPPQASWGAILSAAQDLTVLTRMPWAWAPSSILIVLTMISFHAVGEGLRDALDPNVTI